MLACMQASWMPIPMHWRLLARKSSSASSTIPRNVFHVFGIDGLVMNDFGDEAVYFCNGDGFSGEIKVFEEDTHDLILFSIFILVVIRHPS